MTSDKVYSILTLLFFLSLSRSLPSLSSNPSLLGLFFETADQPCLALELRISKHTTRPVAEALVILMAPRDRR